MSREASAEANVGDKLGVLRTLAFSSVAAALLCLGSLTRDDVDRKTASNDFLFTLLRK